MSQQSTDTLLGSRTIEPRAGKSAVLTLHLPAVMLEDIEHLADGLGCNLSCCARLAWYLAGHEVGAGKPGQVTCRDLLDGEKLPTRVELPLSAWRQVTEESERLDRSRSWMLQRAWLLARARLGAPAQDA